VEAKKIRLLLCYWRGINKILEQDLFMLATEQKLTPSDVFIMRILFVQEEQTISKIAEAGLWGVTTVMQYIKRLQKNKLVETSKRKNDQRITYVKLTEKGRGIIASMSDVFDPRLRLFNFIADFHDENDTNRKLIDDIITLETKINEHFHGSNFVKWVQNSSDR
jgi:MarR family protease production transcriptional regulator HPr